MDVALENLPGKADSNADATPKGVPKVQNPRYKTGTNLSGKRTECVRKLFSPPPKNGNGGIFCFPIAFLSVDTVVFTDKESKKNGRAVADY